MLVGKIVKSKKKSKSVQVKRPWKPTELWHVKDPTFLDNRRIYAGKILSPTHRLRFTPQEDYFSASGTHFCQRLSKPQGLMRLKGLGENSFTSWGLEPETFLLVA
jgi:hypothetical protein